MIYPYISFKRKRIILYASFFLFIFSIQPSNARSKPFTRPVNEVSTHPDFATDLHVPGDIGYLVNEYKATTTDFILPENDPVPANDLIENAQELSFNTTGSCDETEVEGTTLGANNELGTFGCDSTNGTPPDVFYAFNSGNYISFYIQISLITQADMLVSISKAGENGEVVFCDTDINTLLLEKHTDYIIRIAPLSGVEGAGNFNICLSAWHICFDDKDPGDPCTTYSHASGYLNNACECDPVITECSNLFYGGTQALSNSNNVIYCGTYGSDNYEYLTNAIAGAEYTLTALEGIDPENGAPPGFITVNTGDSIFSGYSPLTFTAVDTGNITINLNLDEYCSWSHAVVYELTAQCISCEYNCPEQQGNYGDPCNDGNPYTLNDTIGGDCNCAGEYEAAGLTVSIIMSISCIERDLSVKLYAPDENTVLYSFTTPIDGTGSFQLSDTIAAGDYDIYAKLAGHLAKGFYNTSISAGSNTLSLGSFEPGDLNNDNAVDLYDLSGFSSVYGTSDGDGNFNPLVDVNCDGYIDFLDLSAQFVDYGQTGAHP